MQQDVGIAVSDQSVVVRDVDPAQSQPLAGREAVGVVSDPDSGGKRDGESSMAVPMAKIRRELRFLSRRF